MNKRVFFYFCFLILVLGTNALTYEKSRIVLITNLLFYLNLEL